MHYTRDNRLAANPFDLRTYPSFAIRPSFLFVVFFVIYFTRSLIVFLVICLLLLLVFLWLKLSR